MNQAAREGVAFAGVIVALVLLAWGLDRLVNWLLTLGDRVRPEQGGGE